MVLFCFFFGTDPRVKFAGVVVEDRKNPPSGLCLPGGFVEVGEMVETSARREVLEETGLEVKALEMLNVFSEPYRDPRRHTVSVTYVAQVVAAQVKVDALDDAAHTSVVMPKLLVEDHQTYKFAFDHRNLVESYCAHMRKLSVNRC